MNTTSSVMRLSTVAVSPFFVASNHVASNSRIARSSSVIRLSPEQVEPARSGPDCSSSTALVRRRRQMPQLVRIAHYIQRLNDVTLNLKRRSLHHPLGCFHDDTGQTIHGREAQPEVVAPPRIRVFARDLNQELRDSIGAVDHV